MSKSTLIANWQDRCLDDTELSGITGGKLLVNGIDCLEDELLSPTSGIIIITTKSEDDAIPWTRLNPTGDRVPLEPLKPSNRK